MGLRVSAGKAGRRRRMTTKLAVPGALGVAALIATPWSNPGASTSMATALTAASSPACYDMVSIAIGGRNDVPVDGANQFVTAPDGTVLPASMSGDYSSHWFTPIIDAPKGAVGTDSYASMYIQYPANMSSYEDAVNAGVANTETVIRSIQARRARTRKFSIVGYSEGADVARRVAMEVGNQTPAATAPTPSSTRNPSSASSSWPTRDAPRARASSPVRRTRTAIPTDSTSHTRPARTVPPVPVRCRARRAASAR